MKAKEFFSRLRIAVDEVEQRVLEDATLPDWENRLEWADWMEQFEGYLDDIRRWKMNAERIKGERTIILTSAQAKALVDWAEAQTTGWGPKFSAAFDVALAVSQELREDGSK